MEYFSVSTSLMARVSYLCISVWNTLPYISQSGLVFLSEPIYESNPALVFLDIISAKHPLPLCVIFPADFLISVRENLLLICINVISLASWLWRVYCFCHCMVLFYKEYLKHYNYTHLTAFLSQPDNWNSILSVAVLYVSVWNTNQRVEKFHPWSVIPKHNFI